MIDRSLIWTGDVNERALPNSTEQRVMFYDTTLRDGEQSVGVVISPSEKLEIARLIDQLGIQRIEAGFPRVSEDDRQAIKLIMDAGLNAEIWGFSRAVAADVEAVMDLGLQSTVIEAPISDLKLRALGVEHDEMLRRIDAAVSFAAGRGVRVAFFGVDGSRASEKFYEAVYRTAIEAGAKEVVVVDTLGIATPEAVKYMIQTTKGIVGPDIPIHFHGHNDFGLATAAAVVAAHAGAQWIHGTMNGMGERAGNTNLPEASLALNALYGIETGMRHELIKAVSTTVQKLCGYTLEPWKPLVGENLFRRETGSVASQFHLPPSIEPYASSVVGTSRSIVLGKKSGLDSIRIKCEDLHLNVPKERWPQLLEDVKQLGVRKRGLVSDSEFMDMVAAGPVPHS